MKISHIELQNIYDMFLGESVKQGIDEFMEQNIENSEIYVTDCLWKADCTIGGIGAYCMPANPVKNPFPAGVERELYRPLQYARSDIDICDVRMHARYVIESVGMHLEAVCRLYLKRQSTLGVFKYNSTTLGKAVRKIEKIGEFNDDIIKAFFDFVAIYNRAKHEINQSEDRERMFNAYDAIVAYFAARELGLIVLRELGVPESFNMYAICEE
ncbi:MAG: hypothetical protein U0L79_08305 [Lachnospiraceae bacterium]|nr:hypothetical protein [Lachnospiraceae bacterium]